MKGWIRREITELIELSFSSYCDLNYRFFVLFEFRYFRSVRTIAGPGGVTGPLPRPNKVREPLGKSSQIGRE